MADAIGPQLLKRASEGELDAVLALSTREELDPLVQIITSKLTNFLVVDASYATHNPDHTKYHTAIGKELRLYGGNTIANIRRGGEGPAYDELVSDVCRKLKIPFEKGQTLQNESNLLDIFLEQRWLALTPVEREQLAANARETALGRTSEKGWYLKAGASALMIPLLASGGWGLLGISMLDPSYKVTVPCVFHIAYLRRKIIGEGRGLSVAQTSLRGVPETANCGDGTASPPEIDDTNEVALLSITEVSDPGHQAWHWIDPGHDGVSRLNSIIQTLPAVGTAAEIAGATRTKYMEVVCNGDLAEAAKGGGFRAFAIGSDGIKEHANLFATDKLAAIANASALMNIASVALAQKHLADISKKLSELKDDVGRVVSFQQDGRRAILTSAIHYFEQIAPAVAAGEHSASALGQIERHEADLIQVQHHLRGDLTAGMQKLEAAKDEGWFSSGQFVNVVARQQRELGDLLQQLVLCLRARALGWQLMCQFPGGEIGKQRRREDILQSLKEFDDRGANLAAFDAKLRNKLEKASSPWSSGEINRRKLELLRYADETLKALSRDTAKMVLAMADVDEMRTALQRPFRLKLKVSNGQIVGANDFNSSEA